MAERKTYVVDMFGNVLAPGYFVVYAIRQADVAHLKPGVVIDTKSGAVKVIGWDSWGKRATRAIWLTKLDRVILVPPGNLSFTVYTSLTKAYNESQKNSGRGVSTDGNSLAACETQQPQLANSASRAEELGYAEDVQDTTTGV